MPIKELFVFSHIRIGDPSQRPHTHPPQHIAEELPVRARVPRNVNLLQHQHRLCTTVEFIHSRLHTLRTSHDRPGYHIRNCYLQHELSPALCDPAVGVSANLPPHCACVDALFGGPPRFGGCGHSETFVRSTQMNLFLKHKHVIVSYGQMHRPCYRVSKMYLKITKFSLRHFFTIPPVCQ